MESRAAVIKRAKTEYPIHELLQKRWSPRAFVAQPVEPDKLRSILEAARWAASGGNLQPWAFVLGTQEDPDLFARLVGCLEEGNVRWAAKAPVLGLSIVRLTRPNGRPNRTAMHDVGLAMQNLVIQATAFDLYVHMMGGYSTEKARSEFAIPDDHEPVAMFALGYLGDPTTLDEKHQQSELTERTRRPLADFVFGARWGEASSLVRE
jgi:nitroreductase